MGFTFALTAHTNTAHGEIKMEVIKDGYLVKCSSINAKGECTIESNLSGGFYKCCAPACRWGYVIEKVN
jgi:hypothetical protein